MRTLLLFYVLLWLWLLTPGTAQAYLDPGAGSLLLQALLGGVAGLVVLLKLFWHRILALFGLGPEKKKK